MAVMALSGCTDSRVDGCEDAIKNTLKSPSSYKRVEAKTVGSSSDATSLIEIKYDAANTYGTLIRGSGTCFYDKASNSVRWSASPDPM